MCIYRFSEKINQANTDTTSPLNRLERFRILNPPLTKLIYMLLGMQRQYINMFDFFPLPQKGAAAATEESDEEDDEDIDFDDEDFEDKIFSAYHQWTANHSLKDV